MPGCNQDDVNPRNPNKRAEDKGTKCKHRQRHQPLLPLTVTPLSLDKHSLPPLPTHSLLSSRLYHPFILWLYSYFLRLTIIRHFMPLQLYWLYRILTYFLSFIRLLGFLSFLRRHFIAMWQIWNPPNY